MSPRPDGELPVDATLKRIVVLFRVLGWAWMLLLVVLTPIEDDGADLAITFAAIALATVWTGVTVWAAQQSDRLGAPWFASADFAVALLIGAASTAAGAQDLFHGGYPMSSLAVIAYAAGLRWTIIGALVLAAEQVVVHIVDDRGDIPAAGSVTFLVFGLLLGWGFDALRDQERRRLAVQDELDRARAAQVRHEERIDLANRLHDSVLQTLSVLRRDADDAEQVRYLARRQERQLRQTISEYRSTYGVSSRAALQGICDEIEDIHRIEVDTVIRGDAELDETQTAVLAAAKEALANAAKHSGAPIVDLYAELDPTRIEVYVRDRGRGFDVSATAAGRGIDHSVRHRLASIGGEATIRSTPGEGTDVELRWPAP